MDIHNEHLCLLSEVSCSMPSKPSYCTIMRWKREGLRGVKLETLLIGGRRYTSVEALHRFIKSVNCKSKHQKT